MRNSPGRKRPSRQSLTRQPSRSRPKQPGAGGLGLLGLMALLNRRHDDEEKHGSLEQSADGARADPRLASLARRGALLGGAQAPGGSMPRGLLHGGIAGAGAGLGTHLGDALGPVVGSLPGALMNSPDAMTTGAGIGGLFGPIAGGAGGYGLANMAMGSAP